MNEVNAFSCKGDRIELNRLVDMLMDGEITEDEILEQEKRKEESVIDSTTPVKVPMKRTKPKQPASK